MATKAKTKVKAKQGKSNKAPKFKLPSYSTLGADVFVVMDDDGGEYSEHLTLDDAVTSIQETVDLCPEDFVDGAEYYVIEKKIVARITVPRVNVNVKVKVEK